MAAKNNFNFQKVLNNSRLYYILVVLLLIPVLFIGTLHSHDWGDDFAQYIHQAGNIVNGIPQSETGFYYSQQNYIGPQAYPIGFPLLIAPIYAFFGNNISAFIIFISLIYIILGLLIVIFYKQYFSPFAALVLALIFVYNPQMLMFKREVMSDIPFTALVVLSFILYQKMRYGKTVDLILLSICLGLMLTIRPAGIVFIFAILIHQGISFVRNNIERKNIAITLVTLVVFPITIYFLINSFLFHIPSGGSIRDYLLFYYSGDVFKIIPINFTHHIEVLQYMYEPESGIIKGFSVLFGAAFITFTAIGFLFRILRKPEAIDWFFMVYIAMLLVFPNNNSGFRLMIPLGFIFLFYAANGLKLIQWQQLEQNSKKVLFGGIVALILYTPAIIQISNSGAFTLDGPQQPKAQEAFNYIKNNIPPNQIIVFAKPRALALYSGCRSMCDPFSNDPTSIHTEISKAGAQYMLVNRSLTGENMQRYQRIMQDRLTKLWSNADFVMYKINPGKHR